MEKTQIEFLEVNKQIVIKCSDNLWEYIQGLRKKGLDNLDIIQVAKIYKEVKNLDLKFEEKENKNGNEKTK